MGDYIESPFGTGSLCTSRMVFSFPPRNETDDSNTPSDLSSRTSVNGAPYLTRRSPKGARIIQSDRASISNSSVHTTTAATSEDLFDYTEQNTDGVPSTSDRKSLYSLEKPTSLFRNQSQSTVGTIREAGSVRSSTTVPSSTREIHSSNIPSYEDEDDSSDDLFLEDYGDVVRAREARVLESKVARVASRSFSVEEVAALQKEVDHWLSEGTPSNLVRVPSSSSSPSLTLPDVHSTLLEFLATQGHPRQSLCVLRCIQGCYGDDFEIKSRRT
jgi:hypothetical protein